MRSSLTVGLVALLAGCVSANVTPYRTLDPKPSPEVVEVFTERQPERAFEEVGVIEVEGINGTSFADMVKKAREEGAKLGADAIIISREPIERVTASATTVGQTTFGGARKHETPRLWVVAVIWKDAR